MFTKNKDYLVITIVIAVLLAGIAVVYYLFAFKNTKPSKQSISTFEECAKAGYPILESFPPQCRTPDGEIFIQGISGRNEDNWETYIGQTFSFQYPSTWKPQPIQSGIGSGAEVINLGIPEVDSEQTIGFTSFTELNKPADIMEEGVVYLDDAQGTKWIRKAGDMISYEYYVNRNGVFGIHVNLPEENIALEKQLDYLITSVYFYDEPLGSVSGVQTEAVESTPESSLPAE